MCKAEDESLEHLLLECTELKSFHDKIWTLLEGKCGTLVPDVEKKWTMLFGITRKKGRCRDTVNMILAFVRQAIFNRRNYALYKGKIKDVWSLFTCTLRAHLKLLFLVEGKDFALHYTENTKPCTVDKRKVIFGF